MRINFKLSFGAKAQRVQQTEIEKTRRDWKVIIGAFAVLVVLAGWGGWALFMTVSTVKVPEGPAYQVANFSREGLNQVVEYYQAEQVKYDEAKISTESIPDPSI